MPVARAHARPNGEGFFFSLIIKGERDKQGEEKYKKSKRAFSVQKGSCSSTIMLINDAGMLLVFPRLI